MIRVSWLDEVISWVLTLVCYTFCMRRKPLLHIFLCSHWRNPMVPSHRLLVSIFVSSHTDLWCTTETGKKKKNFTSAIEVSYVADLWDVTDWRLEKENNVSNPFASRYNTFRHSCPTYITNYFPAKVTQLKHPTDSSVNAGMVINEFT